MILSRLLWDARLALHLRGQSRMPFRPMGEIIAAQSRRVRRMIDFAYRTVPYYRDTLDRLGLRPHDFSGADSLARLPFIDHTELQRDPEYFVSRVHREAALLKLRSSGSSGSPHTVYHDADAILQNAAHSARDRAAMTGLLGKKLGFKLSIITSKESAFCEVLEFSRRRSFFPRGVRIERQLLWLGDPPEKNVALLNLFQPDVLHGYGSYLERLFPYLHASGRPFRKPKVVLYGADSLSESVRSLITRTFGIPVFSTYQAIEAFKIGFECPQHSGLHLNIDLYPVRILDGNGRALAPGEVGNVVVSNLVNRGTVLLNYRLGDVAALLPQACACGRSLPLLSFVQGRSNEWLELAQGPPLHSQVVNGIFRDEQQVWQHQVTQTSRARFRVAIVAAPHADHAIITQRIREKFSKVCGEEIDLQIDFVDEIEKTAAGKLRTVIGYGDVGTGVT